MLKHMLAVEARNKRLAKIKAKTVFIKFKDRKVYVSVTVRDEIRAVLESIINAKMRLGIGAANLKRLAKSHVEAELRTAAAANGHSFTFYKTRLQQTKHTMIFTVELGKREDL